MGDKQGADDLFFAAAGEAAREQGKIVPADEHIVSEKKGTSFDDDEHDVEAEEGVTLPTEEEMETLRHVADGINWSTYRSYSLCIIRVHQYLT